MDGNSFTYGILVGVGLTVLVEYIRTSSIPKGTSIPKTTIRKRAKRQWWQRGDKPPEWTGDDR